MQIVKLFIAVGVPLLAGFIGSIFTTPNIPTWYAELVKPTLNPPAWVFGPVWTALYITIGIALFLVWKKNFFVVHHIFERRKAWNRWSARLWEGDLQRANTVTVFLVQLVLNMLWSYLFFALQSPLLALFGIAALWVAIVYVIINFYRISKAAAYLLVPYLFWVSFAAYLNYSIWILN